MEYLGYVAANNPPPKYYLRRPLRQSLQRSNSTKTASPTKKSFPGGHRRTNSNDSSQSRPAQDVASPPSLGATSSASHDSPQLSALSPQGDQPLNRQQQQQQQQQHTGDRNKGHPLPSLTSAEERSQGLESSTSLSTLPGHNESFSASSPLSTFPAPSSTAGSLRRPAIPIVPDPATKRKIRKHRRVPGEKAHIGATEQLQDTRGGRLQEQEVEEYREPDPGQDGNSHRVRGTQSYSAEHAYDCESGPVPEHGLEHDQHPLHQTDHDQRLDPHNHQKQRIQQHIPKQQQQRHQQANYVSIVPVPTAIFAKNTAKPPPRSESVSGASGLTAVTSYTMMSSEPPSSADGGGSSSQSLLSTASNQAKPFVVRNGRTYLADPTLPYPLPVDLAELHRQSLRSLLLFQLFGGPVCSPAFANKPPTRVLEVGCGSAFWSTMCNQYYTRQGHRGISFTGIDIAPIGLGSRMAGKGRPSQPGPADKEKDNMNWHFVQHDIRRLPWPFEAEEFDLIMIKDVSLTVRSDMYQLVFAECIRLLQPNGTLEVWDSDHAIRLLRPHLPTAPASLSPDEEDDYSSATKAGAYVLTPNTPFSAPLNTYIVDYNAWLMKALEARSLPSAQCALVGALFLQEAESLTNVSSRRLVVPLSEMRWEREGVGGVVTKDGKTYIETKGLPKAMGKTREVEQGKNSISPAQSALRRTALLTVVQLIQSLEPILREVSGKSQDEWDGWSGKMMNDLMKDNGTFWGECLEVGAWWAQKR